MQDVFSRLQLFHICRKFNVASGRYVSVSGQTEHGYYWRAENRHLK